MVSATAGGQYAHENAAAGRTKEKRPGQMSVQGVKNLVPIAFALGIAVVVTTIMTTVTEEVGNQVNTTEAQNVADTGVSSLQGFVDWFDLVVLMAITVVLLGALLIIQRYNMFGGGGSA